MNEVMLSDKLSGLTVAQVLDFDHGADHALMVADTNDTFRHVKTIILAERISRVPVMQRDRLLGVLHLRDVVSSIDRGLADTRISEQPGTYKDNRSWATIELAAGFFEAVAALRSRSALVVIDRGRPVTLFTARTVADFTSAYARPFMALEYLETLLRLTLRTLPPDTETELFELLRESRDLEAYDVDRFDFATYQESLSRMWTALPLRELDKQVVLDKLDNIREVRNSLVHFHEHPSRLQVAAVDIDRFSELLAGCLKLSFTPPSLSEPQ